MDVVIGGGTAGLSAGRVLEEKGRDYVIIDRKREIGKPVRSTGAVSNYFAEYLSMPLEKSILAAEIRTVDFRNDTGLHVAMDTDDPIAFVYDFTKYEKFLSRGLNIRLGENVESIEGNIVKTDREEYIADNIIVATGPMSNIHLKNESQDSYWIGYEETRKLPAKSDYDLTIWFSRYARKGYIWDFPYNEGMRKIGIAFSRSVEDNPKAKLEEFSATHPELDGEVSSTMSHYLRISSPPEEVVRGNILLAGDAASACLASTGGGLQGAFWTGREAAKAISEGSPGKYQEEWASRIRPLLLRHYRIRKVMDSSGDRQWESIFRMMDGFVWKSVMKRRDFIRLGARVLSRHPRMFVGALSLIMSGLFTPHI